MYNTVRLNRNNYKYILPLNEDRGRFNTINEDFVDFYNCIGITEKLLLFRWVKLLKYNENICGYCWSTKFGKDKYILNSIYVDDTCDLLPAYKTLLDSFPKNKLIVYNCEKNTYNYELLHQLGFKKKEGTLGMKASLNNADYDFNSEDISFIPLQKGKHEEIRCIIQNEVFKNDARVPLTIDDMYYDELQSYYCEDGAVFVRHGDSFIGYGQIILTDKIPVIVNVGILSEYRGNGYGKLLMNYLMRFLKQKGFNEVKLKVATDNNRAINLYTSLGFQAVDETYQWEYIK